MIARLPYAYLRKSRVFRDKRALSPEMQLAEVTALAQRLGHTGPLTVLEDMNISGRKGRAGRPGFARLLDDVEAGRVSVIYSYSLSRLSRSVRDIMDLADVCRQHDVPIHLVADNDPDPTTASGRMMLGFLAVMAQFEADVASERARDTIELRRSRGDQLGPTTYAHPELVRDAFEEAGSYQGAAKVLNGNGVPTRNGRGVWYATVVRAIMEREYPDLLPAKAHRRAGAQSRGTSTFARLLRCHCGGVMSPRRWVQKGRWPYISYHCSRGRQLANHGRTDITERAILDWAVAEAALLTPPRAIVTGEDSAETRNALLARKIRIGKAFAAGAMEEQDFDDQLEAISAQLAQLDEAGQEIPLEPIDWAKPSEELNRALRSMWSHIQLDEDLNPVGAQWWVPEWRARVAA